MKPTPDTIALLRSIAAAPDDDTPRLVFADWLDDNSTDDADIARAEFIRLSCKMKTKLRMSPAEGKWLDANVHRLLPSVLKKFQKAKVKDLGLSRSGRNVRIHTTLGGIRVDGESEDPGHIFLHIEFWRGFARRIEYGTMMPGSFPNIGNELAIDEPLAVHQPESFLFLEIGEEQLNRFIVDAKRCGDRNVWERLEGYARIENGTNKIFVRTGKRDFNAWQQFGEEVVLGHIRKAMTSVARENSGWPIDWNLE